MPKTPQEVLSDDAFWALPALERQKVLSSLDPSFAGLPQQEKFKVIGERNPKNYQPPPEPSLSGFGKNVVSSAGRFAGDIATAVTSPIKTGKALGGLAAGAVEKAIPGGPYPHEKNVDALVGMYKERYGGIDNIRKTAYEDPVGMLADVSTATSGVGGIAKVGRLGRVSRAAGAVANATDPIRMVGKVAGAIPVPKRLTPEGLYQSALKPSLAEKNRPRIAPEVATGLNEGIPVSEKGVAKLHKLIDDLNTQVQDKIQSAAASGATVDPYAVAGKARDVQQKFRYQVNPQADLRAIEQSRRGFLRSSGEVPATTTSPFVPAPPIPIDTAQKIKTGTYTQLRKKYGQLGSAEIETQKALARGIKEEIAKQIPEIDAINARESRAIDLDGQLEKSVARVGNHQIAGIGTPITAAGFKAASGSSAVAAVAGFVRAVLDDPVLKSKIAIAVHKARLGKPMKFGPSNIATATSRVQEYVDSLGR